MSREFNNGPAFPVFPDTGVGHSTAFHGMTLRDYFAAKLMQAIVSQAEFKIHPNDDVIGGRTAAWAYTLADAMLAERAK